MDKIDLTIIDRLVESIGTDAENVLEILQAIQSRFSYLPQESLERVCEITEITPASIAGISTFYDQFRHSPAGEHTIRVCVGTACHVKGSGRVYDAFLRHLDIAENKDTDEEGLFTVERVACLGCCTLAPAVQIGGVTYGHVASDTVGKVIDDFLLRESTKATAKKVAPDESEEIDPYGEIRLGLGSCCVARGSGKLQEAVQEVIARTHIKAAVKHVGCVGMCYQTPLLDIIQPDGQRFLYTRVEPEDARGILLKHFKIDSLKTKLSNSVSAALDRILNDQIGEDLHKYPANVRENEIADFLDMQKHIASEHSGTIAPTDLDEYLSYGGFDAFEKCLKASDSAAIISQIEKSGLRGRGGAGFPTYRKWDAVSKIEADQKYVVCNGDEGDPGAFMDRMLMESYPYRVIEGVAIAAFTVGATQGKFYIRAEYPLAIKRITEAIDRCKEHGYLGENIKGSGFSLDLKIVPGAGAFVCGEETALLASIEGRRGMPRLRPPYPAQSGLWGKPTLINNVETYSMVPWILQHGGDEFAKFGTEGSKGTKVFALAGKVARGGLIEVPMGVTIGQIVNEIGGGIGSDLKFKAVQVGGPSGGCVPAELGDTPVDYESLGKVGAIMGSGGLVVLDESDCMVDIARYFLEFTQNQSCGKCTFCRIGTRRMLDILERICQGNGKKDDIEQLEDLAVMIKQGSLCGLGKTAPNPVLSTIKYFRNEYQAHIEGRCPAGRCQSLITYSITDDCIGCTLCAQHCPVDAIEMKPYEKHEIDTEKCIRCDGCKKICPVDAVKIT
ncbi:MAG TPA: 4Fe-4S dicluster domain-containing protein [Phycisphaerales bacterium]|nr:4Fe-4S dicluster domain-containing protein [Phycisphaerales bacterium]